MRAVAFFDVDGTLVPGISSAVYLAGYFGTAQAVFEAEAAWDAGLMSPREVEELDARGWAGTSERQVREWLVQLPLVDGIAEVVEWCLRHDVVPALATLAWYPVGSYLCETFGFVDTCGPLLEVRDGIYTGIPLSSCDEYAKRDFAERFAKERGFSLDQCVAVGDSFSDLPLFEDVGLAIAFNATERARALADVDVTGGDLRAVLPHLRSWLG